jgi:leader peptidase (prepilin peptidase)/N-methyltransferase
VQAIPSLVLYASVTGALVGLCVQWWQRFPVATAIPFGPFLALAGILILFYDYAPLG